MTTTKIIEWITPWRRHAAEPETDGLTALTGDPDDNDAADIARLREEALATVGAPSAQRHT